VRLPSAYIWKFRMLTQCEPSTSLSSKAGRTSRSRQTGRRVGQITPPVGRLNNKQIQKKKQEAGI